MGPRRWTHVLHANGDGEVEDDFWDESGSATGDGSPQIGRSHNIVMSFYECGGVAS
jgi:hypothetical protein